MFHIQSEIAGSTEYRPKVSEGIEKDLAKLSSDLCRILTIEVSKLVRLSEIKCGVENKYCNSRTKILYS